MYTKIPRLSLRVLVVFLVSLFACSGAMASTTATVNCDELDFRAEASTAAEALGVLPQGAQVEILGTSGSWTMLSYEGRTGYAISAGLTTSTTGKRIKAYAVRNAPAYKSASTSSKKLGTVPKGTLVYVVGKSGSFYKVQNSSGSRTGYMATSSLGRSKPSGSSGSGKGTSKVQTVIAAAKKQLGKPYVLASCGPGSFDCSGLTYAAFRQVGITLSRSAQSQGYNAGRKVTRSQLKAGDIVCFDTNPNDGDKSDHVGIYLGSGQFIHASSAAGKVVISSIYSSYYSSVFSWGRRLL